MADTTTPNLALTKPEVGASTDTWGTKLNTDMDVLDALFAAGPVLLLSKGGTGASTASGARTNIGLGTIATQNANAVTLTGGTESGIAISASTVDSTPIGATTPSTGKFTTVQLSSTLTFPDLTTMVTASTAYSSNTISKTANFTLTIGQNRQFVKADATGGSFTLTLPTAVGNTGILYDVKKMDSTANTVTVNTTSAQTIDGVSTVVLYSQYDAVTLVSDGANWSIL